MSENGMVKVQTAQTVAETHGGSFVPATSNATAAKEQTRAIAEVQAAMLIARMNPRNEAEAIERIKNSCQRASLASRARYSYPKGGQEVKGATIHILTACAGHWGNLDYGWREIERYADYSKCMAFAWDIQGNVKTAIEFDVPHIIDTKTGPKKMRDQRDIYELCANMSARRVRSCLERIIPRDVVDEALAECDKTLKADVKDLPGAIEKMKDAYEEIGVSRAQIEKRLGRKLESFTAAQVIKLREIFQSIRDEMSDTSDWFEEIEAANPTVAQQVKAAHAAPASVSKPQEVNTATGEVSPLGEISHIYTDLFGKDTARTNEAISRWTNGECGTIAKLYGAPEHIIESALIAARAEHATYQTA